MSWILKLEVPIGPSLRDDFLISNITRDKSGLRGYEGVVYSVDVITNVLFKYISIIIVEQSRLI
jgi:hypothetical protein